MRFTSCTAGSRSTRPPSTALTLRNTTRAALALGEPGSTLGRVTSASEARMKLLVA